ncbi:hypothetical protein B0F90DRAFT_1815573 [Multifurca ochricompacta]|uniref:RRM domain-containing protein n=1 Tax=Multifurca ochricompacta TaxID=376703 RepID=A0AAD4M7N7_9AGAM|nr:hypothetical protein B0F90DRAFT_1815573 [Multifurca ochricompacta]
MPTMEPFTPSTPTPPQPPISPPRPSAVTNSATQITSSTSPVVTHPEAYAPLTPPAVLSHSVPRVPEPPSATTATKADPSDSRVPNVYINGLPPNFPEEQLYALTKDFGGIVSVRTFTRHVSDRPSGYGFVLYETIEGAEKCIEALRRYRNLHPSFCKAGTRYASLSSSGTQLALSSSSSGTDGDSFKARMERLKDEASTNLYVEGLPLSIDEPTMAALVSPYTIKSSRFFQTRLSHPPRTIAFVRLETRTACEEIIKRLHGRMVRGWNDPGSRISVRFADSAEQRELRRSERSGHGGDSSPARLTMAQAALLNLRGQQSQADVNDIPNTYHQHSRLPPHAVASQYPLEPVESSLVATSRSVPSRLHECNEPPAPGGLPTALGSEIDLSTLSRAAGANGFTPLEQQFILQARLQAEIDARQRAFYGSQSSNSLSGGPNQAPSLRSDQSEEEFSRSMNNLNLRSALPAKEFVPRGSVSRLNQSQAYNSTHSSRLSVDLLPSEMTDDYHASKSHGSQQSHSLQFSSSTQQQPGSANAINSRVLGLTSKDSSLKNNNISAQHEEQQNLAAHMRSTTLPPHFTVNSPSTAHNTGAVSLRLNGILSPTLHCGTGIGDRGHIGRLNVPSSELLSNREIDTLPSEVNVKLMHPHNAVADSPFLIPSPALTYNSSSSASSRTPSTLSPSTPFFGSFPHTVDSFGSYNGEEHGGDKADAAMAHDVAAFDIGSKIRSGSG